MTSYIKRASVTCMVSINMRKCGLRESRFAEITGDPELEPWFYIECDSCLDEPPRWHIDKTMIVTKDGESCHVVLPDCFMGPKEYISSDEQLIIQAAIRRYVKQRVE